MKIVQIRSFFWSVFSRIRTEYGEIRSISPYSVRMRENTDQKKLHIWTLFMQWVFIKVWQQEFFLLYFLSFHSRIDIGKIKLKRSNKDQWKQFKQQVAAKNWNQEAIICCFGRFSCTKESPILTVRMKKYEPLDTKNFVSFTDFYELSLENRTIFIVFPETLVMFW